jgi:hypothetical protein
MTVQLVLSAAAVLAIIYIVPFVFYGIGSRFVAMPSPDDSGPGRFLVGVFVTKLGTAVAFVCLYWVSRAAWDDRWPLYAMLWFVMFAASEIGDLVSRRSTSSEAVIGIASEIVYTPLAAWVMFAMLGA